MNTMGTVMMNSRRLPTTNDLPSHPNLFIQHIDIMKILTLLICSCFASVALAQGETPGAPQDVPIAIVGATLHTVDGETIPQGTLVIVDGKITGVGTDVELPEGQLRTVDATGKHIYPGLFEAHSQIGLKEIGAVSATIDTTETGQINSNVKAHVAVNPDSAVIPVTRANGVLLALTCPSGGLISGQASVIQLDGWTYEDLTLEPSVAMHIRWPSTTISAFRRARMSESEIKEAKKEQEKRLVEIRDFFDEARAYQAARKSKAINQPFDLRLESMIPVIEGRQKILVRADSLGQIESAVAFANEQEVSIIILGGYDAPLCADLLKENDIPVIISAVYRLPRRRGDVFDSAYSLPQRLKLAGVRFCISGTDRSETWNARILPDHAATAVAYGLSREDALRSITLSPAEIFGVDDRVGSLTPGKDATFFVADGDILEIQTNVTLAYIQGRKVDLRSKHTRLYEKYKQKYNQLEKSGQ